MTALTPKKQPAVVCTIKRLRRAIAACERAQYISRVFGAELKLFVLCVCVCLGGTPFLFHADIFYFFSAVSFTASEICVPMPVVTTKEHSSRGIQEVGIKKNMALLALAL